MIEQTYKMYLKERKIVEWQHSRLLLDVSHHFCVQLGTISYDFDKFLNESGICSRHTL